MDDLDQAPPVSSSADSAPRPPPPFQYQFVREPEDEDEDDDEEEEEEEEEDEDREELEVLERKPAAGLAAASPAPALGGAPAPPAAPERPAPAAASPSAPPDDDDEDDEPPARPPPPPPAAPPCPPAAPPRRGSAGPADETLFALPAASEPVIPSSAEKIMDLKVQPGNSVSADQEDCSSVLLETAASLPSLSPLSATSFKEHEYLGNLPTVSSMEGALQETLSEASKEFSEKAKNPFVDRGLTECSELEYSEMGSSFSGLPKAASAMLVENAREEITVTSTDEEENADSDTIPRNPQESPTGLTKVAKEDEIKPSDKTKDGFNGMGVAAPPPMREEYADFKPFEKVWEVKDTSQRCSDVLDARGNKESQLESMMEKKDVTDTLEQTSYEKDSESSDGASFPTTPEAMEDSSRAYITCAPFSPKATESIAASIFPLLEDHTSENKTDEKKIEEKKAQIVTGKTSTKTSNPFLVETRDSETDYIAADSLSKVTEDVVVNLPAEGLTPDLVQEACESELNEATGTKISYETKMDLVKTSETIQESLYPAAQLCPSFEESEATPSPVLPDIVMEAPLNSLVPSAGASMVQPSSSPLEASPSADHDNVKHEPENPPPYEEAVNISVNKVPGIKDEVKEPESIIATVPETEAPYISIACDLIKETKLSTEASPDFSNYSDIAKVEKPVSDHSELVEDSSPDSEPVDLFSDDSIPEVPQKQEETVILTKESLKETSFQSVVEHEHLEKLSALPSEGGKPYLESFLPNLDITKNTLSLDEISVIKKEKIPLQMEELSTAVYSSNDLLISKEANMRDSSPDSSPIEIIDEFPTYVSSETESSKLTREYTDLELPHKTGIAKVQDAAGLWPCSESPHELSFKNIHPKDEYKIPVSDEFSKNMSELSKMPLLPPDISALATQTEIDSLVKPKVLMKEAEKKFPSDTEKEDRPPPVTFSAELSKTSVVDLLYWRDIKKTGVVFGASLFLLLSLTVFSIVSVTAYIALALLSVTISFRIYKGVIQAIQKSDEGHPFRAYLESEVAISEELVQKYSNSVLGHVNCTIKELRRLFLVDDLVDSLKFAVLMWVFTYVGALFNGLTLLILALISLFSVPVIYERHQAQIDHYLGLANKSVKDAMAKIQAKIPGLKRKAE
ncbi:reticulon-4 isoform 1-T1 [Ctenodactylus gundi]